MEQGTDDDYEMDRSETATQAQFLEDTMEDARSDTMAVLEPSDILPANDRIDDDVDVEFQDEQVIDIENATGLPQTRPLLSTAPGASEMSVLAAHDDRIYETATPGVAVSAEPSVTFAVASAGAETHRGIHGEIVVVTESMTDHNTQSNVKEGNDALSTGQTEALVLEAQEEDELREDEDEAEVVADTNNHSESAEEGDIRESNEAEAEEVGYEEEGDEEHAVEDQYEPTAVRLSFNGQDFVIWPASEIPSYLRSKGNTAAGEAPQTSMRDAQDRIADVEEVEAPSLRISQAIIWQPLDNLFASLRERPALGEFLEESSELVLTFPDLGLEVPEDNIYCRDITLDDLLQLHHGLGYSFSLHIAVAERSRFITKYNDLAQRVAKILGSQLEYSEDELDAGTDQLETSQNAAQPKKEPDASDQVTASAPSPTHENPEEASDGTDGTAKQRLARSGEPPANVSGHVVMSEQVQSDLIKDPEASQSGRTSVQQGAGDQTADSGTSQKKHVGDLLGESVPSSELNRHEEDGGEEFEAQGQVQDVSQTKPEHDDEESSGDGDNGQAEENELSEKDEVGVEHHQEEDLVAQQVDGQEEEEDAEEEEADEVDEAEEEGEKALPEEDAEAVEFELEGQNFEGAESDDHANAEHALLTAREDQEYEDGGEEEDAGEEDELEEEEAENEQQQEDTLGYGEAAGGEDIYEESYVEEVWSENDATEQGQNVAQDVDPPVELGNGAVEASKNGAETSHQNAGDIADDEEEQIVEYVEEGEERVHTANGSDRPHGPLAGKVMNSEVEVDPTRKRTLDDEEDPSTYVTLEEAENKRIRMD